MVGINTYPSFFIFIFGGENWKLRKEAGGMGVGGLLSWFLQKCPFLSIRYGFCSNHSRKCFHIRGSREQALNPGLHFLPRDAHLPLPRREFPAPLLVCASFRCPSLSSFLAQQRRAELLQPSTFHRSCFIKYLSSARHGPVLLWVLKTWHLRQRSQS